MRILVFGGTGPTGIQVIRHCIRALHSCTIVVFVRSPEKLPIDISSNPFVVVITGQLDDVDALSKAMEGPVTTVISTLGPGLKHPTGTPLAQSYARIMDAMHSHGTRRLIALGTTSIADPKDKFSLQFGVLVPLASMFAKDAYKDVIEVGKTIREQGDKLGLDWTIARVPLLTNQESKEFLAGYIGDGKTKTSLSRAAFAAFVVGEIDKREWLKQLPVISSP